MVQRSMPGIIVIQWHPHHLRGIEQSIREVSSACADGIVFTTKFDHVTEVTSAHAEAGRHTVVVTGYRLHATGKYDGTDLAVLTRLVNPRSRVLMYSVTPEAHPCIDVAIPKAHEAVHRGRHPLLARVLARPDVATAPIHEIRAFVAAHDPLSQQPRVE